jgi:tetratricopeptide (TPR) repeat protein
VLELASDLLPRMTRTLSLAAIRREWPPAALLVERAAEMVETDGATAARWSRVAGKLSPDDAEVLNSAAWLLLIMPDEKHRDPETALAYARAAVRLTDRSDHMILDTLALALFETGHILEAIEIQKKAVEMAPDMEDYRERLARFRARVAAG